MGVPTFFARKPPAQGPEPWQGPASSPLRVDRVAFLAHLPRFLLRGELAWSILPGKPHGQRERSDRAPMPTLCASQFMLHSPPRQACLEEVGRPERFPRSLLSVWGVTSRLVSAGEGDHAQSSTDPTSRGDGSHVLPAWWLCAGGTRVGPCAGWAAVGCDHRLWFPTAARSPRGCTPVLQRA